MYMASKNILEWGSKNVRSSQGKASWGVCSQWAELRHRVLEGQGTKMILGALVGHGKGSGLFWRDTSWEVMESFLNM